MEIFEGYIINITPYKEYDCIFTLITPEKNITVKARNLYKNSSPYQLLVKDLNKVKIECYKGPLNYLMLRGGDIVLNFYDFILNNNFYLLYYELMKELLHKFYNPEDNSLYYKLIEETCLRVKKNNDKRFILSFVITILRLNGVFKKFDSVDDIKQTVIDSNFQILDSFLDKKEMNDIINIQNLKYIGISNYNLAGSIDKIIIFYLRLLEINTSTKIKSIDLLKIHL